MRSTSTGSPTSRSRSSARCCRWLPLRRSFPGRSRTCASVPGVTSSPRRISTTVPPADGAWGRFEATRASGRGLRSAARAGRHGMWWQQRVRRCAQEHARNHTADRHERRKGCRPDDFHVDHRDQDFEHQERRIIRGRTLRRRRRSREQRKLQRNRSIGRRPGRRKRKSQQRNQRRRGIGRRRLQPHRRRQRPIAAADWLRAAILGRRWPSEARTQGAWRAGHASDRGRRLAPASGVLRGGDQRGAVGQTRGLVEAEVLDRDADLGVGRLGARARALLLGTARAP